MDNQLHQIYRGMNLIIQSQTSTVEPRKLALVKGASDKQKQIGMPFWTMLATLVTVANNDWSNTARYLGVPSASPKRHKVGVMENPWLLSSDTTVHL